MPVDGDLESFGAQVVRADDAVIVPVQGGIHGGGDLIIRSPRPNVRKVFSITKLDRVLTIED